MNRNNDRLNIKDKVLLFKAESTKGEISLTDHKGEYLALYFNPNDFTPGYTVQAQEFTQLYDKFQKINTKYNLSFNSSY